MPDPFGDYKRHIWDGISTANDEDDQKSTCSTWDLRSTQDGWNEEPAIDPHVFSQFMTQALRPRWESKMQDAGASTQWASATRSAQGEAPGKPLDVATRAASGRGGTNASSSSLC